MPQAATRRYWKRITVWVALVIAMTAAWIYYADYIVDAYARLFGVRSSNLLPWQWIGLFSVLYLAALLLASLIGVWNKEHSPPRYVAVIASLGPLLVMMALQMAVAICSNNPDFGCSLGRIMPP